MLAQQECFVQDRSMKSGPDIARIANLIGDPARANMLDALMGGQALTAGELADVAGIGAPTASVHLARLEVGKVAGWALPIPAAMTMSMPVAAVEMPTMLRMAPTVLGYARITVVMVVMVRVPRASTLMLQPHSLRLPTTPVRATIVVVTVTATVVEVLRAA